MSEFKSTQNRFLTVRDSVILTPIIDPVIVALDPYFQKAGLKAMVTSGYRDAKSQLRIIQNALERYKISQNYQSAFGDIDALVEYEGHEVFGWQPGWSKLLNLGYIVNPPYPAACLMDYYRPGSKANKKGQIINSSPHSRSTAFDVSGGTDGIEQETAVIKSAIGKVRGLVGVLPERTNNAIHVDCKL